MAYEEESSDSCDQEPWIHWFCGLKGHEMFCEVERAYIEDGFNLYGLRASVPNYSDCLDILLDRIRADDSDDSHSHLTQSACTLYGMIHARYIISGHGLDAMYNKYAAKEFGTCTLMQCLGQPVLPVGLKDEVGADTVKVFCPKCRSVYQPPVSHSRGGRCVVDGAFFGTTFPHLFLMTFSSLVPDGLSPESVYVPRIFGFRVANINLVVTAPQDKGNPQSEGAQPVPAAGNQHNIGGASLSQLQPVTTENTNANSQDQKDGNNMLVDGSTLKNQANKRSEAHVDGNGNGNSGNLVENNRCNKPKRQKRS